LAITAKAKAMRAQGVNVISFASGEPDFDTPENVKEAAIHALRDGFTKYTPVGGIDELKEAIIEKFQRDNQVTYEKSEIVVSCGAKHSLYNIAQACFQKGDEVVVISPHWVSYPDITLLAGATPKFVATSEERGFKVGVDQLRKAISRKTKAIVVNSPSNPTGSAYVRSELEQVAELAVDRGLLLISDEIYEKFAYDGFVATSMASLGPEVKGSTIVVNGLSKTYSMTGWRIGYAAGPAGIMGAATKIQSQSTSNPTSIAQRAGIEALSGPQTFVENMVREFAHRRNVMVGKLNAIEGVTCSLPLGSFYAFPNFSSFHSRHYKDKGIGGSTGLAEFLLDVARVAVVPGKEFGSDPHLRLSYATSLESIDEGLDRIAEAVRQLE
jgi:aspartate aminotransferase